MRFLFTFYVIILCSNFTGAQQFSCNVLGATGSSSNSGCEVDLNQLTTKVVRVTFHVFQKNDGTGNIPNTNYGKGWLWLMNEHANTAMANLDPMNLQTSSPYFSDTKIRFKYMGEYFWKNTSMWSKGDNTASNLDALTNFVMNQNISNKNNSIHVLIPGNFQQNGGFPAGGGAYLGNVKSTIMKNVYHHFTTNQVDLIGNALRHEYGHNLNLRHSWISNDGCNDTPPNNNCWGNGAQVCSNNTMDYNNHQCALTLCQVSKMHKRINQKPEILYSGVQYGNLSISLSNSGNNGSVGGSTINVGSSSATVNVSAPGVNSFNWTYQSGNGSFSAFNNGKTVNLSGLGSVILKVTWVENCMTYSRSLAFFNAGYYFNIAPNPTNGPVTIKINTENELGMVDSNGKISFKKLDISKIEVFSPSSKLIQKIPVSNNELKLDLSRNRSGNYTVVFFDDKPIYKLRLAKI